MGLSHWLRFVLAAMCSLALGSTAFGSERDDDRSEHDDDEEHECPHRAPCPGSSRFLDVRIQDFRSSGRDAPTAAHVYLGRTEIFPSGGVYRVPLLQNGAWIRDTFDLKHVDRNGLRAGSYVIVRTGWGSVVQGVVGFMRNGTAYYKAQATAVNLHVAKLINGPREKFERQGNGIAVPMRAGDDEYALSGTVLTVQSTVTSRGDLVEEEFTCDNLCANVTCPGPDSCHTPGVCDPGTGACSNPKKADGESCSDGNKCNGAETCRAGACVTTPNTVVTCAPPDQCHLPGVCVASTGLCSYAPVADNTDCNDGDACTVGDVCTAGACAGAPKVCTAQDQCHGVGTCIPGTGECTVPNLSDGAPCSDGDQCTEHDTCQSGMCEGGPQKDCTGTALNQCQKAVCDSEAGACVAKDVTDPTPGSCTDGNPCTDGDYCVSGACAAGARLDQVTAGTCSNGYACFNGLCGDIDECALGGANNCSVNAICDNTDRSFRCTCKPGYTGNGVTCTDIDECTTGGANNCSPNATCNNTEGSFTCQCKAGYTGNGINCTDIDECPAVPIVATCSWNVAAQNAVNELAGVIANPSGAWSYYYGPSSAGAGSVAEYLATSLVLYSAADHTGAWYGSPTLRGYVKNFALNVPMVVTNTSSNPAGAITPYGAHVRFAELLYHPGPPGSGGRYDTIRWTAPASGTFRVDAEWRVADSAQVDFAIVKNHRKSGVETLSTGRSTGNGTHRTLTLTLAAGDTLDFAVGMGADFGGATTGIAIKVQRTDGDCPANCVDANNNGVCDEFDIARPSPCGAHATCGNTPGSFTCACDPGYAGASANGGSATCTQCAPGTYVTPGAATCTQCPAGTSSGAGATSCTSCAPGTHAATAGSASCTACGAIDDGNPCTVDSCDPAVGVVHVPGNSGAECRPSMGVCDVAEYCDGFSADCPTDLKRTGVCGVPTGECDLIASCSGVDNECPRNPVKDAGTKCREAVAMCDVAEYCTGSTPECPPDRFHPAGTVCRASSGACDPAETCDGASAACPLDAKAVNGSPCSDGLACNGAETCQSGSCTPGTPMSCNTGHCVEGASHATCDCTGTGYTGTNCETASCVPPALPAACQNDLSNIGTGDFRIQLTVTTTDNGLSSLINQRPICSRPEDYPNGWWELRMYGGAVFFEVAQSVNGVNSNYLSLTSRIISDGNPHVVLVQRVSGVVTLSVDCQVDATGNSTASLGPIGTPSSTNDPCSVPSGLTTINGVCVSHAPCAPNPCRNGGTCSEDGTGYTCACAGGYSGPICDVAPAPVDSPVPFVPGCGEQTVTIPAGASKVTIRAWGAGGGGSYQSRGGSGSFALVEGLAVTPGQVLHIKVGGGGIGRYGCSFDASGGCTINPTPLPRGKGGCNGGGTGGGNIGSSTFEAYFAGGGGGGMTSVYLDGVLALVASGGGGAGGGNALSNTSQFYQTGGGGGDGDGKALPFPCAQPGRKGTSGGGGAGGTSCINWPGALGTSFQGGNGGCLQNVNGKTCGGGGGGGLFGGGGGGGGSDGSGASGGGAGGGGGATYVNTGLPHVSHAIGFGSSPTSGPLTPPFSGGDPGGVGDAKYPGNKTGRGSDDYGVPGYPGAVVITF